MGTPEGGTRIAIPRSRVGHSWTVKGTPTLGQSAVDALAILGTIGILAIVIPATVK